MMISEAVLEGVEGSSPLGFLAALGTLITLNEKWPGLVRMSWTRTAGYRPIVRYPGEAGVLPLEQGRRHLAEAIAQKLHVPAPMISADHRAEVKKLFKGFQTERKALKEKEESLKKRQNELRQDGRQTGMQADILRTWVSEQTKDLQAEINKQRTCLEEVRRRWLDAQKKIVPAQELGLGKTLSVTATEYRDAAMAALNSCDDARDRREVDFLAAFATESITDQTQVATTPLCFVSGAGHQYFLETVSELMRQVNAEQIEDCLFQTWTFDDEGLSLRWAPVEDRRYALRWDNPSGQEVRTVWAANLLAYNGLRLLPVVDVGGRPGSTGFAGFTVKGNERRFFTWPIWQGFLCLDTVRSLLSLSALRQLDINREGLDRIGILEVFRSERLRIGKYTNFGASFPAGTGEET